MCWNRSIYNRSLYFEWIPKLQILTNNKTNKNDWRQPVTWPLRVGIRRNETGNLTATPYTMRTHRLSPDVPCVNTNTGKNTLSCRNVRWCRGLEDNKTLHLPPARFRKITPALLEEQPRTSPPFPLAFEYSFVSSLPVSWWLYLQA